MNGNVTTNSANREGCIKCRTITAGDCFVCRRPVCTVSKVTIYNSNVFFSHQE